MTRPGQDPDSDSGERFGVPRWVRLAVLVGVLVAAVIVVVLLTMGGGHNPPSHLPPIGGQE